MGLPNFVTAAEVTPPNLRSLRLALGRDEVLPREYVEQADSYRTIESVTSVIYKQLMTTINNRNRALEELVIEKKGKTMGTIATYCMKKVPLISFLRLPNPYEATLQSKQGERIIQMMENFYRLLSHCTQRKYEEDPVYRAAVNRRQHDDFLYYYNPPIVG